MFKCPNCGGWHEDSAVIACSTELQKVSDRSVDAETERCAKIAEDVARFAWRYPNATPEEVGKAIAAEIRSKSAQIVARRCHCTEAFTRNGVCTRCGWPV